MVSTSQNSLLTTKILRIARRLTNCDGDLKVGAGNAIFTAECYNFNCIRTYVKYGNPICPTGDAKWKDIPSVGPAPAALRPRIPKRRIHNRVISEPLVYNDDDPIDFQSNFSSNNNSIIRSIDIKTHTEFPAVPLSVSQENFHILVNLKSNLTGNSDTCRTPIYLVTVLDINSSMRGEKIQLLKGAMRFVIQNLGPSDRLSVISFSSDAHRLFPLLLMTDSGKQRALQALNSLFASSMTNIVEGLKKGTKVIEDRRTRARTQGRSTLKKFLNHDPIMLHSIAESSKGTFSFIEAERVIQEAFPQRIGGLLSVVLQDLQVHIQSLDPHLCISQLKAGGYSTSLTGENQVGSVDIGDLYANEERDFLVLVNLPVATDGNSNDQMKLVSVWCVYKDPFIKEPVTTEAIQVKLQRPEIVNEDMAVSIEVDRQKNRLQVAERLRLCVIRMLLLREISETASAHAGDTFSADLDVELEEVRSRMVNKKTYERAGRGYLLSGMRAHSRQTAATRGVSVGSMYDTDCMRGMMTCAICNLAMEVGDGKPMQNALTASIFLCVVSNAKSGSQTCIICQTKWKVNPLQANWEGRPFQLGAISPDLSNKRVRTNMEAYHPLVTNAPLPANVGTFESNVLGPRTLNFWVNEDSLDSQPQFTSNSSPYIDIKTYPEMSAVQRSIMKENFSVLINLKALLTDNMQDNDAAHASQSCRAPVDLVTVLDVSGSMKGSKIELLKRAMRFVIENLGPSDRLSIVTFSTYANQLLPLRRMNVLGKQQALSAVNSLATGNGTHIFNGLRMGASVIDSRKEKNPFCNENQTGFIDVGDLYENEEKGFLISLNVPAVGGEDLRLWRKDS
ncbi:hypothetical protein C5167_018723 [Papaver somniferum]|uniref:VWFA domain-containing protein n=1 Tax=Papaver somniferum TaxID=3469 RepID=A0A4Y7IR66_PAPSO|nr:hypothetical protein C5167_018723 [Papaver somniferum]